MWSFPWMLPSEEVAETSGTNFIGPSRALSSLQGLWCALTGITSLGVSDNTLESTWPLTSARRWRRSRACSSWLAVSGVNSGQPVGLGSPFSILPQPAEPSSALPYLPSKNDNCFSSTSMSHDEAKPDYSAWRKDSLEVLEQHSTRNRLRNIPSHLILIPAVT